jgi:hypothetical protein
MTLCLVRMIFVLPEDIHSVSAIYVNLLQEKFVLICMGVTIHFSVNNFDSNLPKFADLTQQIIKFFDKCPI